MINRPLVARLTLSVVLLLSVAAPGALATTLSTPPNVDASFVAGSLQIDRYGKGDAVVLLPGLTAGTWEWYDTIRHLDVHHTVYAISLPGFDGRPAANPPLFDRFTSDFWSFVNTQHVARPIVITWMGDRRKTSRQEVPSRTTRKASRTSAVF